MAKYLSIRAIENYYCGVLEPARDGTGRSEGSVFAHAPRIRYSMGMPRIEPAKVKISEGSSYPSPFDEPCRERRVERLGNAVGLTQFGANLVTLLPGAWASQRHWHEREDEFLYVVAGELVLVEDAGETLLTVGDSAGWPAGVRDGHHLINKSNRPARFLVVGSRDDEDQGEYADIDMAFAKGRYSSGKAGIYRHKDGTPY